MNLEKCVRELEVFLLRGREDLNIYIYLNDKKKFNLMFKSSALKIMNRGHFKKISKY